MENLCACPGCEVPRVEPDQAGSFFCPWDIEIAHHNFGATCGPIAFAAVLGRDVCAVMQFFRDPFPGWCSGRDMEDALRRATIPFSVARAADATLLPREGLAWISLVGPWSDPRLPRGAQLSHSHWIAVRGVYVYDPNLNAWHERAKWEELGLKPWLQRTRRATGWKCLQMMEVAP